MNNFWLDRWFKILFSVLPEVDIDFDTLAIASGGSVEFNCIVKSLTPVKITWSFESKILKEKFAK